VSAQDHTSNGRDVILGAKLATEAAPDRIRGRPPRCKLPSGLIEAMVAQIDVRASDHMNRIKLRPPATATVHSADAGNEPSGDVSSNSRRVSHTGLRRGQCPQILLNRHA